MWGQAVDHLCGTALWTAQRAGTDRGAAWDAACEVADLLAEDVPALRARPRLFPIEWSGDAERFQVKGTCCLWYRRLPSTVSCRVEYCT
jgi:hypothetical protein